MNLLIFILPLLIPEFNDNPYDSLRQQLEYAQNEQRVEILLEMADYQNYRDQEKSLELVEQALPLARALDMSRAEARLINLKAGVLMDFGKLSEARQLYETCLKLSEQRQDSSMQASIMTNIALTLQLSHQYPEALEYFLSALEIDKQRGDEEGLGYSYDNVGNILRQMEQHEKASGYLEKSLEIRERIGHHAGAAMSSLHLGLNYQAQKQYEPALHYLQKAVDLFRQAGYDMHYHTALYYQQQIYQLIGQYEQAAKLLGQVISFEKSFGNREALAEAYIAAAELHTQKNHGDSASYYLEEAKAVLMESGELESDPPLPGQWAAYHLAVSQLAEAQGNFQKALEHQALHFEIKERQDEARETKKIAEMEANYQLRVQKAQLELAETEKAALKQENKTIILISLITGFSLLLMVAAAWYIYRVRQRHIRQLTLNNAELENANHALERFVYSVSHDLKAPIASSRGLIELMRMEEPGAVVSEYLNMMEASMLKQEFFIKEVLDYSKNERLEISRNDIDFHTLIPELLDKFNHLPEAERVERLSFIEQEVPFVSDQSRVAVLLSNLITNGLRYHDPRKEQAYLKIEIRVDDEYAFVEISDNGLGIAEENQQKIFDMFYRAHDHKDGSGLGLYIVKETLRKLGGCISLYSREGEGTRFTFELPNLSKNQKEEIPKQPQTVKINAPVRD